MLFGRSLRILSLISKQRLFSRGYSAEVLSTDCGEKFSVYSFLLAGGLVKDIVVKDFDVCLEIPRQSLIPVFAIFKYHSLLNFDFLVDILS